MSVPWGLSPHRILTHARHISRLGQVSRSITLQMVEEQALDVSLSLRHASKFVRTHSQFADATDLTFTNLYGTGFRGPAISISQCTTFSGAHGNCTSSKFELENIKMSHLHGTTATNTVASFQCSAVKPCHDITLTDIDLTLTTNGTEASAYLCGNVEDPHGWNCTGAVCVGGSATGGC